MKAAALLLLLAAAPLRAQVASIALLPATTAPSLGMPLEIGVSAKLPAGAALSLDASSQDWGAFELLEARRVSAEDKEGGRTETWVLTVFAAELGTVQFPALRWTMSGSEGSRVLKSAPARLEVSPPETVKDEAAPMEPARAPWAPPGSVLERRRSWIALLLLLLAAVGAYALWRRRRTAPSLVPQGPYADLPPEEEARRALADLDASGCWERGDHAGYYERLAQITRRWLERRHDVPAFRLTTRDTVRRLRRLALREGEDVQVRMVLESADLVKFAKSKPADEDRDRDRGRLLGLLVPPPEPAAPREAAT